MAKVGKEVEVKLKKRLDAGRTFIDEQLTAFRSAVEKTIKLMPVQAAVLFVGDTIENVTKLIGRQAEITREWLKR